MAMRKKTARAMKEARLARQAAISDYHRYMDESLPEHDELEAIRQAAKAEGYNDLGQTATFLAHHTLRHGGTETDYFRSLAIYAEDLKQNRGDYAHVVVGKRYHDTGEEGDYKQDLADARKQIDELIASMTAEQAKPALSWIFNHVRDRELAAMPCNEAVN